MGRGISAAWDLASVHGYDHGWRASVSGSECKLKCVLHRKLAHVGERVFSVGNAFIVCSSTSTFV